MTEAEGISAAAWQAPQVPHLWAVSLSGAAWSCEEDATCTACAWVGAGAQNAWDTAAKPWKGIASITAHNKNARKRHMPKILSARRPAEITCW